MALTLDGNREVVEPTRLPSRKGAERLSLVHIDWLVPKDFTLQSASGANDDGTVAVLDGNYGSLTLQVKGATWTGTLNFEATQDGTNYIAIEGVNKNTGAKVTTATGDVLVVFDVTGVKKFKARQSGFSAGTVTATATATAMPPNAALSDTGVTVDSALPAGDNNIGNVDLASAIPAGTALIGKVSIDQVTANANEVVVKGSSVMQAATSTPVASGTADAQGIAAAAGLRLIGFSVAETAATAADAELVLRHGTLATDPILCRITLSPDESARDWFGPDGIAVASGVFVDRVTGTSELTLFTKVVS